MVDHRLCVARFIQVLQLVAINIIITSTYDTRRFSKYCVLIFIVGPDTSVMFGYKNLTTGRQIQNW